MVRKIVAIITACTGDRVIVTQDQLSHVLDKFTVSPSIVLEQLELILRDPSDIFRERTGMHPEHLIFYRREIDRYFVAVIKRKTEGVFLCTMHSTGKKIRNKHKRLERLT